jgi:hypothetical protein
MQQESAGPAFREGRREVPGVSEEGKETVKSKCRSLFFNELNSSDISIIDSVL